MTEEQRKRLAEHRGDFTFYTSDLRPQSDGRSSAKQRSMRLRNRSVKHSKQWRLSAQERSVLRYSTET